MVGGGSTGKFKMVGGPSPSLKKLPTPQTVIAGIALTLKQVMLNGICDIFGSSCYSNDEIFLLKHAVCDIIIKIIVHKVIIVRFTYYF